MNSGEVRDVCSAAPLYLFHPTANCGPRVYGYFTGTVLLTIVDPTVTVTVTLPLSAASGRTGTGHVDAQIVTGIGPKGVGTKIGTGPMEPNSPACGVTRRSKPVVVAKIVTGGVVTGGVTGMGPTGGVVTDCDGTPGVEMIVCGGIVNGPTQIMSAGVQIFGIGISGVLTLCGWIAGVLTVCAGILGVDCPGTVSDGTVRKTVWDGTPRPISSLNTLRWAQASFDSPGWQSS